MGLFGQVAGNTLNKSVSVIGDSTSNSIGGFTSGMSGGAPMTTSAARKSPQENQTYARPQEAEDNTMMYVTGGIGVIAVAGTVYMVLKK